MTSWTEAEARRANPVFRVPHHVGVVPEDGEGLGRQGAGGDMEDRGGHLSGHLVHDRDHQQETLGRGKGRRHGSGRERTDGTCGASFGR